MSYEIGREVTKSVGPCGGYDLAVGLYRTPPRQERGPDATRLHADQTPDD
jgi:hypothetical protein